MSDQFKALIVNQEGENFTREVKSIDKKFLKHGDVTVQVDYSDLNFKDGMILKNGGRLVKEFPHIPGIDFSGKVLESENPKFNDNRSLFTKEDTSDWLNQSADLETVSLTFFEQFWQLESNKNCECKYETKKKKLMLFS